MTTSGMYATVASVESDAVVLEISPGVDDPLRQGSSRAGLPADVPDDDESVEESESADDATSDDPHRGTHRRPARKRPAGSLARHPPGRDPAGKIGEEALVATPTASRPGRTLIVLGVVIVAVFALIWFVAPNKIGDEQLSASQKFQPRLGLDLEGGTSVILTPRVAEGRRGQRHQGRPGPGGLHHPQPGRQLRRRRVGDHHGRQQHRHLGARQAGQVDPRHGQADRRAALPSGAGQRCRRAVDAPAVRLAQRDRHGVAVTERDGHTVGEPVAVGHHRQPRPPEGAQGQCDRQPERASPTARAEPDRGRPRAARTAARA